ncbi:MAG: phosphatase PAP2 family protein [Candidatus Rhabdochlamydia sp.]
MKSKQFTLSLFIVLFLYASFLMPTTRLVWDALDQEVFRFLNTYFLKYGPFQYFWALVNHKYMDFVEDGIFLLFFILSIQKTAPHLRSQKTVHYIFSIVLGACIIFFINKLFFRSYAIFPRESPSLTFTPCIRITEILPWQLLKDSTTVSFPGDHATLLLIFGLLYSAFATKKLSLAAWGYVIFRILPRLIVGAHWFSDIAVGSFSIALFFTSLFLYTPLGVRIMDWMEKILFKREGVINFETENTLS